MSHLKKIKKYSSNASKYYSLMTKLKRAIPKLKNNLVKLKKCGTLCNKLTNKFKKNIGKSVVYAGQYGGKINTLNGGSDLDILTGGDSSEDLTNKISEKIKEFGDLLKDFPNTNELNTIGNYISTSKKEKQDLESLIEGLKKDMKKKEAKMFQVEQNLKSGLKESGDKSTAELKALEAEKKLLTDEKNELKAQLGEAMKDKEEIKKLEAKIKTLESSSKGNEKELIEQYEKKIKVIQDKYSATNKNIFDAVKSTVDVSATKMADYKKKVAELMSLISSIPSPNQSQSENKSNAFINQIGYILSNDFKVSEDMIKSKLADIVTAVKSNDDSRKAYDKPNGDNILAGQVARQIFNGFFKQKGGSKKKKSKK